MASRDFIYAYGNGNDGDRASCIVTLNDDDCPWALAEVMIPNRFIPGCKQRSFAYRNVTVDGDAEYDIYATLHEGMRGETDMGAAYMTATLSPLKDNDYDFYHDLQKTSVKDFLDVYAYRRYLKIKDK